jgi:hypothetical protein
MADSGMQVTLDLPRNSVKRIMKLNSEVGNISAVRNGLVFQKENNNLE